MGKMTPEVWLRTPLSVCSDTGIRTVVCEDGSVWELQVDGIDWVQLCPVPGTMQAHAREEGRR